MSDWIHVVAGVLRDAQGNILLAQRPVDKHLGGLWEFPGGKRESNESAVDALSRELHEELGLTQIHSRPLIQVRHDYGDKKIFLDVYLVTVWQGEPAGKEGQPLAWVSLKEMERYDMPAADEPIIKALKLSTRYLITPPDLSAAEVLGQLKVNLDKGERLFQWRLFGLDAEDWSEALAEANALAANYDASIMVNASVDDQKKYQLTSWHLNSRQLHELSERPEAVVMLSASCHNEKDLQQAEKLGVDFCVLSPVLPTRSHPDATPLGWDVFKGLVEKVNVPVFALGGMSRVQEAKALESGAQGVAGIRGLWRSA
jgi:8-oxo-dGTP diphosphatase